MKTIIKIIILSLIFTGVSAEELKKGSCSNDLILHQNLKAPKIGERYIKNGKYNGYTKSIVREAHILQKHLNRLGFNAGKVDGIIGPKTRGAILRLQKFLGTTQDGYVGPKTRALLNDSCGSKISTSEKNEKFSGNLKVAYGEKSLIDFIQKTKNYNKLSFGDNLVFGIGDNILENISAPQNYLKRNTSLRSSDKISLEGISSSDFSRTNNQVDGVDESDISKTDGKYIYTISKSKKLFIFDALNPKGMRVVSKINASKNESMREIYLHKNKLILISNYWENSNNFKKRILAHPYIINDYFTRVEVYDISDPKRPVKVKKVDFEGSLKESRIIKNHLYFVSNKWINDNISILPMVRIDNKISTNNFGNSFYYIDTPFINKNLTSITSLNLDDLSKISSKRILMPNLGSIYISKDNLYLTYNKFINTNIIYEKLDEKVSSLLLDREKKLDNENIKILSNGKIEYTIDDSEIDEVEIIIDKNFNSSVVNSSVRKYTQKEKDKNLKNLLSKKNKIDEDFKKELKVVVKEFYIKNKDNFEKTKIEKFSLNDGKILATASGEVSGLTLNQFSMHEDSDKNFFIATTKNENWLPWQLRGFIGNNFSVNKSENNLYSLDKNLKNLDSIEGIAKGERIKSVRFVKDHAYLVTFKQTDPLFNINISNPKRLKLLGELKIDGFSQYLHPVFKDRLIGLGRDVYVDKYGNQRNGGLKVTLFDISRDNPREIKSIVLGGNNSYSEALNNHKAILISENKNIMAFPVTLYQKSKSDNLYYRDNKTGVILLNLEKNNISKISLLESEKGWEEKAKRALRIGDVIHTISNEKDRVFNLKNGDEMGKIYFENKKEIITY